MTAARRFSGLASLIVACAAFALYAATVAPGLYPRDSGELVTAAATLGIPHPPAYPTYVLLGRAAASVPVGDVALRVNLLSALLGAVAVGLAFSVVRRLSGSAPAALFAAATLGLSRVFWQHATVAEVFTLHLALVLGALRLLLAWHDRPPERRGAPLLALGALGGLALGNQHTAVLVAPGLLVALASAEPRTLRSRAFLRAVGLGLLVAAALYAFVLLRSRQDPFLDWGDPETLPRLLDVFLRREFGSLSLSRHFPADPSWTNRQAHLALLARGSLEQGGLIGAPLAALGAWALLADRARRFAGWALVLGWIATGPALALLLGGTRLDDNVAYLAERLHLGSFALLALLAGVGLGALLARLARAPGRRGTALALGAAALALLLGPALTARRSAAACDRREHLVGSRYAQDLLASLPERALVITINDTTAFGLWMLQQVEGRRPDVDVVLPLENPAALAQVRRRLAATLAAEPAVGRAFAARVFPPGVGGAQGDLLRDLTHRALHRRPVLLVAGDDALTGPLSPFLTPRGLLLELGERPDAPLPPALAEGARLLDAVYRLPRAPGAGEPRPYPERDLRRRYALALEAAGAAHLRQAEDAQAARRLRGALDVDPDLGSARARLELLLRLQGTFAQEPPLVQARLLVEAERWPQAVEVLARIVAEQPRLARPRANLGYALLRAGRLDEAAPELERALAAATDDATRGAVKKHLAELALRR